MIGDINNWRVLDEESLSDHAYIVFEVGKHLPRDRVPPGGTIDEFPRWAAKKMDADLFQAAIMAKCCLEWDPDSKTVDELAEWLRIAMTEACDVAAPRVRYNRRRQAYWWSELLDRLKKATVRSRRLFTRLRRRHRGNPCPELDTARRAYKIAKKEFRHAIEEAKLSSWRELLSTLDQDPWG